jgi:hypothetical protein
MDCSTVSNVVLHCIAVHPCIAALCGVAALPCVAAPQFVAAALKVVTDPAQHVAPLPCGAAPQLDSGPQCNAAPCINSDSVPIHESFLQIVALGKTCATLDPPIDTYYFPAIEKKDDSTEEMSVMAFATRGQPLLQLGCNIVDDFFFLNLFLLRPNAQVCLECIGDGMKYRRVLQVLPRGPVNIKR